MQQLALNVKHVVVACLGLLSLVAWQPSRPLCSLYGSQFWCLAEQVWVSGFLSSRLSRPGSGMVTKWGAFGFSADKTIREWVGGKVLGITSLMKFGPSGPGRLRVLLQEKGVGGGKPLSPFGVPAWGPLSEGWLQHAKGSEWLEEVRQGCLPVLKILGLGSEGSGPVVGVGAVMWQCVPGVELDLSASHSCDVRKPEHFGSKTEIVQMGQSGFR
jgi:hypothetical protein